MHCAHLDWHPDDVKGVRQLIKEHWRELYREKDLTNADVSATIPSADVVLVSLPCSCSLYRSFLAAG